MEEGRTKYKNCKNELKLIFYLSSCIYLYKTQL